MGPSLKEDILQLLKDYLDVEVTFEPWFAARGNGRGAKVSANICFAGELVASHKSEVDLSREPDDDRY